jgi:hypothetical protein
METLGYVFAMVKMVVASDTLNSNMVRRRTTRTMRVRRNISIYLSVRGFGHLQTVVGT